MSLSAFVAVWGAARAWFDRRIADTAVIFLACWPGSMFLWAFLTEGLFVTATAGAFWADKRDRRWLVFGLIFVATITRSVGVVFAPALVALRVWRQRRIDQPALIYTVSWAASLATLLIIMQTSVGDAFAPFKSQKAWGRSLDFPWVPLYDGATHIIDKFPTPALETSMNITVSLAFLALGLWGVRHAANRRPSSATNPARSCPLSPGLWTLAAGQVTSMLRYALGAWPGFVLLAIFTDERPRLRYALLGAQALVSLWLLRRSAMGVWVA